MNRSSVSIIGLALPNLLGFSLNLARKVKLSPLIERFGLVKAGQQGEPVNLFGRSR